MKVGLFRRAGVSWASPFGECGYHLWLASCVPSINMANPITPAGDWLTAGLVADLHRNSLRKT